MTKILVIGQCTLHWGRMEFGNIGNYYIVEPFFREIHRVFPNSEIRTTFQMSEEFQKKENVKSVPMDLYYNWSDNDLTIAYKEYAIASIFKETNKLIDTTPFINEVLSADLVIDFSGDIWGQNADLVGPNRFLVGLLKDRVVQLLGKPSAMIAGSPGPFNRDNTLDLAKTVFKNFDLVTNREEISKQILKDYGFDTSKVYDLACPAFEFEPAEINNIESHIKGSPIEKKEKPTIGFVLCGWNMLQGPFNRTDWKDEEFHPYIKLLENLIIKYDVNVCLLSHSNGFILPPNFKLIKGRDFPIVEKVYNLLQLNPRLKDNIYLFNDIYTPAETKAIIGQFDMLISGRVHAAVAGLSQSVPTVIIDYGHEPKAHKLRGFAKVANVENYIVDPHLNDELITISEYVFEHRSFIHAKLQERNKEIRKLIEKNFDLLISIVKK